MSTANQLHETKQEAHLDSAILFVSRPNIRPVLRQELKAAGISNITTPDNNKQCIELLSANEGALLIVDYEHGLEELSQILSAAVGQFRIDTRPIFLISLAIDRSVIGVGAEYQVGRVHTGEISKQAIAEHLQAIIQDETGSQSLRTRLLKVADFKRRQDFNGALGELQHVHSEHPGDRRVSCELADCLMTLERWEEAQIILEQMAVVDTYNLRSRHLMARYLMHKRKFKEAGEILQEAKLLNPYNVERLVDLGHALLHIGDYNQALANFNEALALDEDFKDAKLGKGQCMLMIGEVNEALSFLREVGSPREMASIFNNAAVQSIHQNDFESGLKLYRTAIGAIGLQEPARARLYFNLGLAYHKWNKLEDAIDCYNKAIKADPTFSKSATNLAVAKQMLANSMPNLGDIVDDFTEDFEDETLNDSIK